MMSTATKPLEELIQELPPVLRAEVRDFVNFCSSSTREPKQRQLRQDWPRRIEGDNQQIRRWICNICGRYFMFV